VIALRQADPQLFRSLTQPAGIILGTITYLMIAIMAVTSFDGAARLLGPSRWRLLHLIAGYEIWAQFMISTGRRVAAEPFYLVFVAMLVAVFAPQRRRVGGAGAMRPNFAPSNTRNGDFMTP
jgi:DMSO/TMAO reductase YedYZ heme-binding membrane subunit